MVMSTGSKTCFVNVIVTFNFGIIHKVLESPGSSFFSFSKPVKSLERSRVLESLPGIP